ncbi:hypothetical protein BJ508DRAFT_164270 [Ascobolus immersus RN42]|uniref:Uncharacterized protein n=1 Tax=Ascobolus immersus RN42 TaxID=1160509 RepID=A0A3N4HVB6_ASCIM|nr:hypothetical protein BJ508DRAFT_164270 [Ascobolus immersus RN42]
MVQVFTGIAMHVSRSRFHISNCGLPQVKLQIHKRMQQRSRAPYDIRFLFFRTVPRELYGMVKIIGPHAHLDNSESEVERGVDKTTALERMALIIHSHSLSILKTTVDVKTITPLESIEANARHSRISVASADSVLFCRNALLVLASQFKTCVCTLFRCLALASQRSGNLLRSCLKRPIRV